jgi:hypothetical protein
MRSIDLLDESIVVRNEHPVLDRKPSLQPGSGGQRRFRSVVEKHRSDLGGQCLQVAVTLQELVVDLGATRNLRVAQHLTSPPHLIDHPLHPGSARLAVRPST